MSRLVDHPDWVFGTRVAAALLAVGVASATFLVNRTENRWRLGFLVLISCAFGLLLKLGFLSFFTSFSEIFDLQFIGLMHIGLVLTLSTLAVSLIFKCLPKDFEPLFFFKKPHIQKFTLDGRPVGLAVALGAFVFGVGMRLSSGCVVGTFVRMGEGIVQSIVVAFFFVVGATLAVQDGFYEAWKKLPATKEDVAMPWYVSVIIAFVLCAVCFVIEFIKYRTEAKNAGGSRFTLRDAQEMLLDGIDPEIDARRQPGYALKLIRMYCTDFGLAVLIGLWFLCVGRPIDVIGGVTQFGSRVVGLFGGKPEEWAFWVDNGIPDNLMRDPTFISNLAILVGAFIGAVIVKKFGSEQENKVVPLIKGAVGGLCLGLGGVMAGGCSITGMLSGITAAAPSGYLWLVAAVLGCGAVFGVEAIVKRYCTEPGSVLIENDQGGRSSKGWLSSRQQQ
jgi:uncharacterized membrane protein YedE/YeeE